MVEKDSEEMDTETTSKDTKAAKGITAKEVTTTDTKAARAADTMTIEVKTRVIRDTITTINQASAK